MVEAGKQMRPPQPLPPGTKVTLTQLLDMVKIGSVKQFV